MKVEINEKDFGTLCICALRYCHGRRTYMPNLVQQIVSEHFTDLSDEDLKIIADDKEFQELCQLWGDYQDRADWLMFYKRLEQFIKEKADERKRTCQKAE